MKHVGIMLLTIATVVGISGYAHGAEPRTCASTGLERGKQSFIVKSGGSSRSVLLFIPEQASARRPLPLVIDLHGSGGNAEGQARLSRFSEVGSKHGFV